MQIESSFTISEAELIIRDLEARGTDTTLTLPTNSRAHVGGGEPAIVQAIVTWASTQTTARITTYESQRDVGQIDKLSRHMVGLCAGLVCDQARDLELQDVTQRIQELAVSRLKALQGLEPQRQSRGPQVEIICADHLGLSWPETLYAVSKPGKPLRSRQEFDVVTDLILNQTMPENMTVPEYDKLRNGLIDTLYELFRNTDEYARTDEKGDQPGKSIRGIHARRHAIAPAGLAKMVKTSPPLAAYCARLSPRPDRRDIQLIEISVFDSGPGYAAHWLKKPLATIGRDEELEAITTCFGKHANHEGKSTSGMGLCIVTDVLRRGNGFMRLRTGRQSLYADLGIEATRGYGELPTLQPWQTVRVAPATGTLFTFFLPL